MPAIAAAVTLSIFCAAYPLRLRGGGILSCRGCGGLSLLPAGFTALRLRQTLGGVERRLACGEDKIRTAIRASDHFI